MSTAQLLRVKYVRGLFMIEGKMGHKIERPIGAALTGTEVVETKQQSLVHWLEREASLYRSL